MEKTCMTEDKFYSLPSLPYDYAALKPVISEEQLKLHHQKHHQAYVNGANLLYERLDKARKENADLDIKATLKELSFHNGGYELHYLVLKNLGPGGKGGGGLPKGSFADAIKAEFGSFERFKKEFTQASTTVEGSGWAALIYCKQCDRLLIMQIEKHNTNIFPGFAIIMVLDVWEHAYYLDYKNDRAKFVDSFWSIVNWDEIGERFEKFK